MKKHNVLRPNFPASRMIDPDEIGEEGGGCFVLFVLAGILLFMFTSCSMSDSSPEVLAQAMSYSGNVPTLTAKGEVSGSQFVGTQHRATMLHP